MVKMQEVKLYDTTLRDGSQREGISFSVEDKLKIAKKLDELGIHYIEGGWPVANNKDNEFFRKVSKLKFQNAKIVAFGSTRRKDRVVETDKNIQSLISAGTSVVCIFGKSWDLHVKEILQTTLKENLAMISDSISYLKEKGLEVVYDAEHFFDGYKNNPDYALKTIKVAEDAGADWIVLCDTNGGTLPLETQQIIRQVRDKIKVPPLGIHAHNDAGFAVANSVIAVHEGILQVQGTINGYGERCGNTDLCSIIPSLVLKLRIQCLNSSQLCQLKEVSHFVSETANIAPDPHQPYVGESAFAHKGGIHINAVIKNSSSYQHIDPKMVGNKKRMVVSELTGKSGLLLKAKELGIDLSTEQVDLILKEIEHLEHEGYHFEVADASLALLLLKQSGNYEPLFDLEEYNVITGGKRADAVVKIYVKGKRFVGYGEGDGPVNALDIALREALEKAGINLSGIELTDYKVRVLDTKRGTAAKVRVLIETSDGKRTWGTVGVSENIIEASWQALVDSIEYGVWTIKKPASLLSVPHLWGGED